MGEKEESKSTDENLNSEQNENTKEPEITDENILAFEQSIKEKEVKSVPLVGEKKPLSILKEEYKDGAESFLQKLQQLEEMGFTMFRRTRGDGNCFYRAFSFLVLELMINHPEKAQENQDRLYDNRGHMLTVGFEEFAFSDFEEEFKGFLECVPALVLNGKEAAMKQLEETMNNYMISNSIVVYMRLLTSAYLKLHADDYLPFLEGQTINTFCNMQVESMDREADEFQITALTNILNIGTKVAYLNAAGSTVNFHEFGNNPETYLLYRPGHYDILYKDE